MVTVETLYKNFGVLADAKDKAGEHDAEFLSILTAVKGGPGEKRLASQFIARFFKYFPKHAFQAINALFDLCEDDDINIRKQAIKDLPSLCKVSSDNVAKISEALTQLLQCDDPMELSLVQSSLVQCITINSKGALEGLFSQILGDDDVVRGKAIQFLRLKLKTLPEDTIHKDTQEFIVTQCKKVLEDVTKDEFISVMDILKSVPSLNTVQGRSQLLEIVVEQAELDQPFEAADHDCVDRLMSCIKQAVPLFSKNVHSTAFVGFICKRVLPQLSDIPSPEEGVDSQLDFLKLFAEIAEFCGELEEQEQCVQTVYDRLTEYMPLPPPSDENEETSSTEEPKLQFSYVECLMHVFHQLGRKCPDFLTGADNSERLKDFRLRLQYFARGVQVYIKQLRQDLLGKTGDDLKKDENKIKVVALKITSNINILIKDLFHNPPSYKCVISLSWKPHASKQTSKTTVSPGQKRYTPITFESNGSSEAKKPPQKHQPRALYAPPSGKFSEKAGSYWEGQGGRGRGGFNRGRGRGRGWRGGRY